MKPIIDPEFKALIPPLTEDELFNLTTNVTREGCREPLVIWKDHGILLDGHNRLYICETHGISCATTELAFTDRDDAKLWIIRNQFGRRNLSDFQRSELALASEAIVRARAKANQKTSTGGANPQLTQISAEAEKIETRQEVAKMAGVSHDTIKKVKMIQRAGVPELLSLARKGAISIASAATVATLPAPQQRLAAEGGPVAIVEAARTIRHTSDTLDAGRDRGGMKVSYQSMVKLKSISDKIGVMTRKPWSKISPLELRVAADEMSAIVGCLLSGDR